MLAIDIHHFGDGFETSIIRRRSQLFALWRPLDKTSVYIVHIRLNVVINLSFHFRDLLVVLA